MRITSPSPPSSVTSSTLCKYCKSVFRCYPSANRKFCSKDCYYFHKKENDYPGQIQKGQSRPEMAGKNNPNWKGDDAGYTSKHQWVVKYFGKASKCEDCNKTKGYFEWANVSGKYNRQREDWKELCKPCHMLFDDVPRKIWETRRQYAK